MAFTLKTFFSIFISVCLFSSLFANHCLCSSPKFFVNGGGFKPALGTWYGEANGAGSGEGACGWANDVSSAPFSSMIAAGNANIFLQGKGCGECYQIKCSREPYCSGNPITVTITDECPACNNVPFHFDLSGAAFSAMANPGQADKLRNLGQVDLQFQRVLCNYGRTKIAFKIDAATNPYWFATRIEFANGDGGLWLVEIAPAGTQEFVPMNNAWGAVWVANIDPSFNGPFSFRLTSPINTVVVARNVVPMGFVPGQTYFSNVNF